MAVICIDQGKTIILDENTTCCFTGHRPEKFPFGNNEKDKRCHMIMMQMQKQIIALNRRGVYQFVTGMSRGVDFWGAEIMLRLNKMIAAGSLPYELKPMEIYGAIPCPEQAEKWKKEDQLRYLELLESITASFQVRDVYSPDCYFARNKMMVDLSSYVLGVYNGVGGGNSGTGQTLAYARQKNRFIILIDPATAQASFSIGSKTVGGQGTHN